MPTDAMGTVRNSPLEHQVKSKLDEILRASSEDASGLENSMSLYGGLGGRLLLNYVAGGHTEIESFDPSLQAQVIHIIELMERSEDLITTFSGGISGTLWLFNRLASEGRIQLSEDFFSDINELIIGSCYNNIVNFNYDFLHGGGGMLFYLLEQRTVDVATLTNLVKCILNIRTEYNGYRIWRYFGYEEEEKVKFVISLGLSHGLPSMMVLLAKAYKKNILPEECKSAIDEIVGFIRSQRNYKRDPDRYAFYPAKIVSDETILYSSRLGWCYGDLGVAMAFYIAGDAIGDSSLIDESIEIFQEYADASNEFKFGVADASFCHGAAGIAYLFGRMWANTRNQAFSKASEYWLKVTLEMGYHQNGIAGYKYWHGPKKGWANNSSLLEGTVGIGLVLSSFLSGANPEWDACFLLN